MFKSLERCSSQATLAEVTTRVKKHNNRNCRRDKGPAEPRPSTTQHTKSVPAARQSLACPTDLISSLQRRVTGKLDNLCVPPTTWQYMALHSSPVHDIALHYIVSHHITSYHITLHYSTSHHMMFTFEFTFAFTLHYITLHYMTCHDMT